MKRCPRCQQTKPLDAFAWHRKARGERKSHCRECQRRENLAQYARDPQRQRARAAAYAKAHPEATRGRMERWRAENRAGLAAYDRAYKAAHRDERRAYDHERRANRPREYWATEYARRREYHAAWSRDHAADLARNERRWREQNPDKHVDKQNRRRARKQAAPIVERIDRQAIIARDNATCYLCGTALTAGQITLDHVLPLSRGGNHTADNLRVCCRRCNCRKHARTLAEYLAERARS